MQAHRRITERCLRREGIAPARVAHIVDQLQTEIQRNLGGVQAYIAQDRPTPAQLAARAAELRAQGLCVGDVAARLGRSKSYVHALLTKKARG